MKPKKKSITKVLKERFNDYSEKELYSMIMCGEISADGETIRSPQQKVFPEVDIVFKKRLYVSRGGEKLDYALRMWGLDVKDKVVLDAGASTGGFTDCLLKFGAKYVHSVDVGYNQLDYSLRTDKRVNVLEKTNIMSIDSLDPEPDFAVADLSFRSIHRAAQKVLKLTNDNMLIALIKPQFEIEQDESFDGVIRDKALLRKVVISTSERLGSEKVRIGSVLESPIKGGKGNTEYLFKLSFSDEIEKENNLKLIFKFFD